MRKIIAACTLIVVCVGITGCGPSKEERVTVQQKADVAREIKAVNDAPAAPIATNN